MPEVENRSIGFRSRKAPTRCSADVGGLLLDACELDSTRAELDDEQHVVADPFEERQDFDGEEIGR